ncbi:MAG TPA: hypothetical protein VF041_09110 [Gemmatimonadaceae bacterium]
MTNRRIALFATVAMLAAAAELPAQSAIVYKPGARTYHLVSVITRTQEVDGQKSKYRITNEQQVSVNLSAHGKDTLDFSYTLDSSRLSSDPPVQLQDVSKMQGTKVTGAMSPRGEVFTITSNRPSDDASVKNLVEGMRRFLLTLPRDAKVGSQWTDTTRSAMRDNGNDLDMSTITTSTIVGDTTLGGERAWRVRRASVLALEGSQNRNGQRMEIHGNGTGDGTYYLSADGAYLGSTGSQQMHMMISMPGSGDTVPVDQAVTSKVEVVK